MKVKELRKLLCNMNDESEVVIKERNGSIINVKNVEETYKRINYDCGEYCGWYTRFNCVIEANEY